MSLNIQRPILQSRPVKVNGLYNLCKARVLVTLYYYQTVKGFKGLTVRHIERIAQVKPRYIDKHLPVFAGLRPSYRTGKFWRHQYLLARAVLAPLGRPEIQYRLSVYGKRWVERLPEKDFLSTIMDLGLS